MGHYDDIRELEYEKNIRERKESAVRIYTKILQTIEDLRISLIQTEIGTADNNRLNNAFHDFLDQMTLYAKEQDILVVDPDIIMDKLKRN